AGIPCSILFFFFLIDEDTVENLLILEALFTQDSEVGDRVCDVSCSSGHSLFFSNKVFSLGFEPV
ncbi:MAG: hypothetical protein AB2693_23735, partial [Candidatus Thiodiazotropha sp.]